MHRIKKQGDRISLHYASSSLKPRNCASIHQNRDGRGGDTREDEFEKAREKVKEM